MFLRNIGFLIVGLCVVCVQAAVLTQNNATRIVGGELTTIDKVPYLVQVLAGSALCGGTLVAPLWVVSAAHCVYDRVAKDVIVVGGAGKLSDPGVRRNVQRIFKPAKYNSKTVHFDVSVLKLASALTGTNIKAISLYTGTISAGMILKVSGWGTTSESGNISNQVQTVNVPVIAKAKCAKKYQAYVSLTKTMVCASTPGTKDACQGDSGGPAICNDKLCGIVSWGYGCARSEFPGVYTSVPSVITFINSAMKN